MQSEIDHLRRQLTLATQRKELATGPQTEQFLGGVPPTRRNVSGEDPTLIESPSARQLGGVVVSDDVLSELYGQ